MYGNRRLLFGRRYFASILLKNAIDLDKITFSKFVRKSLLVCMTIGVYTDNRSLGLVSMKPAKTILFFHHTLLDV